MTIAGGGQTSARVHRQTVPYSRSVTTRGRRQGGGGRLGPCTRMDDGAITEEYGERAAHHLRAACRVYTLRPPPPYAPDKRGLPPTPCHAPRAPFATLRARERPFRPTASRASAPARCARQEVAQTGGRGTPAALRYAAGRLRALASKERITRPRVPPPPCRLSAFMRGCVCLPRSSQGRASLLWWTAGRPRRKGHDTGRTPPAGTDCRAPCCSAPRSGSCQDGARGRSLFPPWYEPSRYASCARIASDCLRVLLALVRVSVPLVDRRLRYASLACPRRHRHGRIHAPGWLASRSPVVRPPARQYTRTAARRKGGYAPPAAALALTPRRRPRP